MLGLAAAVVAGPAIASAQTLTTDGVPTGFSGTGLGTVATLLTLSSQGNATTEMGCVGRNSTGTADVINSLASGACTTAGTALDVQTGASQTQTQLLSALGITNTSQFGILLNSTEPSGNSITLNSLTATFYNASGGVIGSVNLGAPSYTFPNTLTGVGSSGFLFTINGGTLSSAYFASGVRVGLAAGLSDATGGNDTFFLVNANAATVTPEPATLALLGTGLLGLAGFARRRRTT